MGVLNLPALYTHTVILNMYGCIHGADYFQTKICNDIYDSGVEALLSPLGMNNLRRVCSLEWGPCNFL